MAATEDWASRGVLVAGGTGEIGLGIAKAFLARGAPVTIVGSRQERLERALSTLAPFGGRLRGLAVDLRSPEAAAGAISAVAQAQGSVRVLVNCAGVIFTCPITEVAEVDYDRVMDSNVKAAFFTSQAGARWMAATGGGGRIINITSGNYRYARTEAALYCASKAALEMLTRAFALEFGRHGITVNAIAPGLVQPTSGDTPPHFVRFADFYMAHSPLRRLATPKDIAEVATFLASERAATITGETIVVDGGFSAGRSDFPSNSQK